MLVLMLGLRAVKVMQIRLNSVFFYVLGGIELQWRVEVDYDGCPSRAGNQVLTGWKTMMSKGGTLGNSNAQVDLVGHSTEASLYYRRNLHEDKSSAKYLLRVRQVVRAPVQWQKY